MKMTTSSKNLINKFMSMDDYDLAREMLSRDLLFHKILPEKVPYYVQSALDIGKQRAKEFMGQNILNLCAQNGIEIIFTKLSGKYFGTRIRAEIIFSKKENQIVIYKNSIEEIKNVLIEFFPDDKHFLPQIVFQMHIAHEFFHFLEWRDNCFVNEQLPKITNFKFLGVERKASILTLSEVAAHSFCQELLGLPYFPYLYDKIYALSLYV